MQVLALLRELGARGVESSLAAPPDGRLARAAHELGVSVLPLAVRNHLDLRAALALRRLVGGHDVVHFHTARAHALAPLCPAQGLRRVVTRRMDYVPAGGPYARFLYNRAVDAVIAISDGVRDALLAAGVRRDRIRVVPSGIDMAGLVPPAGARETLRQEWGIRDDQILVLVPGALEPRKGHAVLLTAAKGLALAMRGLRYVVCGEGRQAAALERSAGSLDGVLDFVGFRHDMPACYAAADIVAMPSLKEGLGVAALEAMAAGRPVVASRVGGLGEAVVDGETGVLVPPGDPATLAIALARLARDAPLRARLGDAGRARVAARYTSARMAEGTLACYENRRCE